MNVVGALGLPGLEADLARVEDELRHAVLSDDAFLSDVAAHLVHAGGKRLRPLLVLVSARNGAEGASDEVIRGAVAVELVHLGSLYHDDVMDEADVRRNVPSVNARWGNLVAILAGDYLLARASELAASLGTEVAELLAATIGRLCQGQLSELRTAYDVTRTEDAYLAAITGKTASLLSAACRIGALAAELPRPAVDALTGFGRAFGMAFQIRDDVLDVIGTEEELGKPAGHDLVEGVYTLPVIRALAGSEGDELRELLGRRLGSPERDKARQLVRSSGGVDESVDTATAFADQAAAALAPLGEHPASAALAGLPRLLLSNLR